MAYTRAPSLVSSAQPERNTTQSSEGTRDPTGPVSSGLALQAEESTFTAKDFFPAPRNPVPFLKYLKTGKSTSSDWQTQYFKSILLTLLTKYCDPFQVSRSNSW